MLLNLGRNVLINKDGAKMPSVVSHINEANNDYSNISAHILNKNRDVCNFQFMEDIPYGIDTPDCWEYDSILYGFMTTIDKNKLNKASNIITIPFSYGDASPKKLFTSQAGNVLLKVTLIINNPFNGLVNNLSVGNNNNNQQLLNYSSIFIDEKGEYSNNHYLIYNTIEDISLYISLSSGVNAGDGYVLIEVID